LQNGIEINLEGYPNNLQETITTVGANGTTDILLASLRNLAEQLMEKGQITPEQESRLIELANKGHEVAR
jgi:hypothetical protein